MLSSIFNWSIVAIMASFTLMPASTGRTTAPTVEPIVEEAELKGCATNFENRELIPFYYDGPDYTPTEVEKSSNWKHGSDPESDCNQQNVVACGLLVSEAYVNNLGSSNPTLDASINLTAAGTGSAPTYVSSIDDSNGEIFNKSM